MNDSTDNITKEHVMAGAQRFVEAGMPDAAQSLLNSKGIKAKIINGRVVDDNDTTEPYLSQFVTQDKAMLEVKDAIRKLSRIDDEVLIVGESGTGKELLAKALHGRRDGKLIALNAGGLPEQLIESELFGHVQGAFTGAYKTKNGMIAEAAGGTLFLDEIGELPILAQAKLLRLLSSKDRKIRKVGGNVDEDVTCRFVFATNRDLRSMCKEGTFRLDLYARISTFELHTTPLTSRVDDIELILNSMVGGKEFLAAYRGALPPTHPTSFKIDHPDLSLNVRSLQQYVKRYKVLGVLP